MNESRKMKSGNRRRRFIKALVFTACLGPVGWLIMLALTHNLGANPIEFINRYLGEWALTFVLLGLALSPASRLAGLRYVISYRRMIGLFAFFYVGLHVSSYVGLDQFFDWSAIWKDIVKRVYITLGMIAFVMLIPLAVTSTNRAVKRLGAKNWKRLHRLVYPAAILGVAHYIMMVKADLREPLIYAAVLALLLALRLNRLFPVIGR